MQIEVYFKQILQTVHNSPLVRSVSISVDDRGVFEGFIRGNLVFIDGTRLHWREFANVQSGLRQLMYSFQYMDAQDRLIFRYDNADHHFDVSTYPHHKHDGSPENVIPSAPPILADVLDEIAQLIGPA